MDKPLSRAIKKVQRKKIEEAVPSRMTRRNVRSQKYRTTTGAFDQAAYDADKDAVETKKGGGRPRKKGGPLATTKGSSVQKTGSSDLATTKSSSVQKTGSSSMTTTNKNSGVTKAEPEAKDQTINVKATEVGGDLAQSKVGSMSNSGKKEVDPSKNDVTRNKTSKQQGPKRKPLKYNSPDRDISKDVDPDSAEKRKDRMDQKNKSRAQSLKKNTGRVIKKTGQMAKSGVQSYTGAFGTSSFSKEGITFKNYLNKL